MCVNFATPQLAVHATVVKMLGIVGGIVLYTIASSILFPRTASQQALSTLGISLGELRDLVSHTLRHAVCCR